MRGALWLVGMLAFPVGASAEEVLRYDFAPGVPFIVDGSGHLNHALAHNATPVVEDGRQGLRLAKEGFVRMPEGEVVFGKTAERGSIEIAVKPDFDPLALPTGVWDGWVVFIYFQKTSGNGLPDGPNEIGLSLHGPKLLAKVSGTTDLGPFAVIDTPLRQGQWTTLRLEWEPGRRALLVDGKLAGEATNAYPAPELDGFPSYVGRHPASGKWGFEGVVADVKVTRN